MTAAWFAAVINLVELNRQRGEVSISAFLRVN